jgi:hypothetical protein
MVSNRADVAVLIEGRVIVDVTLRVVVRSVCVRALSS